MLKKDKIATLSNFLTVTRIALAPVVALAIAQEMWKMAFVLFAVAALTDLLDGYFARFFDEHTYFGAFLDPLADKILMLSVLAALVFFHCPSFAIPRWFFGVIVARELLLIGGSTLFYLSKINFVVRPTLIGKAGMMFQSIFILWLFVCRFMHWEPQKTYYFFVCIIVSAILVSFIQYARSAWRFLQKSH